MNDIEKEENKSVPTLPVATSLMEIGVHLGLLFLNTHELPQPSNDWVGASRGRFLSSEQNKQRIVKCDRALLRAGGNDDELALMVEPKNFRLSVGLRKIKWKKKLTQDGGEMRSGIIFVMGVSG